MKRIRKLYLVILVLIINFGLLLSASDIKMIIKGDIAPFQSKMKITETKPGVRIHSLILTVEEPTVPKTFRLFFRIPAVDICSLWKNNSGNNKYIYPNWSSRAKVTSRAAQNAPVFSLINLHDRNRLTLACSDALNTVTLVAGFKEEDAHFDCEVIFFSEKHPPISSYGIDVRIDTRAIPYYQALDDVASWWTTYRVYQPMTIPKYARLPMYSSWYTFHQNLVAEEVLKQCELAKKMGYHSVIIDDGWQTLDSSRGYSFTGDWKPDRIPDMKKFVSNVHKLGMKFILWYSVPYIGDKSKNYERFKGKYLDYWSGEWGGSYTLDPRYPEVREFLITTYENALKDWDLDGFKLDFVDNFVARKNTELSIADGRDYASVNRAFDRLMTDIKKRLTRIKPDILIEFRQSYIGPLMRKYGNMFRAGDCPGSYLLNRVRTTDLRLLSGDTAVHSDMVMWHPKEPVESAALQMINILFSVPQLSVRLDLLPQNHLDMIKFWTDYWQTNRSILLDGEFIPSNPTANYPVIRAQTGKMVIISVFDNQMISLDPTWKNLDIVNGKLTPEVFVKIPRPMGNANMVVMDCQGKIVEKNAVNLMAGILEFKAPPSGIIQIRKKK